MRIRSIRAILFSALFACVVLCMSTASFAQVGIAISVGPPALPVYEQPACPGDGYLWTPGYWAYNYDVSDYYWVPGTWVEAPEVGFLWTPPYWGWGVDRFLFHAGYWGPHIGFYGGINYGFGYFGAGFEGGRWDGGHFFYNRSVTNINITNIHNTYNTTIINRNDNRVSFNGGRGGIDVHPTPEQEAAEHDRHIGPVEAQTKHMDEARSNPRQRASANMGKPEIAATEKPGDWKGRGVVPAKEAGAPYHPEERGGNAARPENHPEENGGKPAVHPRELPEVKHPDAPNTGDANRDKKYQQQQDKMVAKQQQERENLQKKQDQEHQRMDQQKVNDQRRQQVEQRHQQQTSQMQQRHQQQAQHMQERVQRASPSRGRR